MIEWAFGFAAGILVSLICVIYNFYLKENEE